MFKDAGFAFFQTVVLQISVNAERLLMAGGEWNHSIAATR